MKLKKKLFLKKVTISNLSEKHMNDLRGGNTGSCGCGSSGVRGDTVNFCAACAPGPCPEVE